MPGPKMPIDKLLVANRGEIAVRVIRSAKSLGLPCVAVFSEADAQAPHVALADEAVCIGPAPSSESYLRIDAILDAAKRTGANAIHPGYGFLSENAAFAQACAEAGVTFVGPPAEAIELMGNKAAAKRAMIAAGVPCVPGYEGEDQSDATFQKEAKRIGFPIMVKAAAGGGGRGMRLVTEEASLADALRAARAEAQGAFGSDELILEKAVTDARHVEIQVFGDGEGNVIHLGERDCSVQRRHQKVIEESPSPAVDEALRAKMGEAAVNAAKACDYVGAGTVEFLLAPSGEFYFLEMNTRLQVEHPVTELVTGVDLVAWQLRIAEGETLPLTQDEVALTGHAIEARLYAEDPARGFLPQTGPLLRWRPADHARVDSGVEEGGVVSPHYDPMIAKVIVQGRDRREACRKLAQALRQSELFGLVTNKTFLARICEHPGFIRGEATTTFLDEHFADDESMRTVAPSDRALASAAVIRTVTGADGLVDDARDVGWRSGGPIWVTVDLDHGDEVVSLQVHTMGKGRFDVRWAEEEARHVELEVVARGDDEIVLTDRPSEEASEAETPNPIQRRVRFALHGAELWLDDGHRVHRLVDVTHRPAQAADGKGSGKIAAPLDGSVLKVFVEAGAEVSEGDLLVVLEAMKMEHRLLADVDGTLETLHVSAGDQVKTRQLLAEIRPQEESKGDE
jgi:geranyl-CoA carboxylase alpha subunit